MREHESGALDKDYPGYPRNGSRVYRNTDAGDYPILGSRGNANLRGIAGPTALARTGFDGERGTGTIASSYIKTIVPISAVFTGIAIIIAIVLAIQQWG